MPSPSILAQLEEEEEFARRHGFTEPAQLELAQRPVDRDWFESSADREKRENPLYVTMSLDRLTTFAYMVAGAATGPLLQDNPGYVFPSGRVSERVREVMADFGLVPSH